MKLCVLGVNHETAPVSIREKVSFPPEQKPSAYQQLKQQKLIQEGVILSTCNRTELYCVLNDDTPERLLTWLHEHFELPDNEITPYLYQHNELEAIKHIMRVACGLNSLVLGEPQILGQVKEAYQHANNNKMVQQELNNLLQQVFKTAKNVRTDTAIGSSPVSVAFSSVALAKQFFGDLSEQTALILGAGETSELVARHLKESHIDNLIIANRTLAKAHNLAEALGGYSIGLHEIADHLHEADIIIASTGSPNTLIHKNEIAQALKKRRHKPIFMVDIAVPRDIDETIADFSDVYLYTVDDLQAIIQENKRSRCDAAAEAEEMIDAQANHFLQKYQASKQVGPLVQSFRQQAQTIKAQQLETAMQQLQRGEDAQKVLTKLANQLTNKLLHTPSHNLNQIGLEGDPDKINLAKQLLLPEN